MMKKILFGLSLLVIVALVLTGCGTGEASKFAPKTIDPSVLKVALQQSKFGCEDYGVPPADKNLTGYQFCEKEELKACSIIISEINRLFFDSVGGKCTGKLQSYLPGSYAIPCEAQIGLNPFNEKFGFGCKDYANSLYSEPYYGDIREDSISQQVVCCGFIVNH